MIQVRAVRDPYYYHGGLAIWIRDRNDDTIGIIIEPLTFTTDYDQGLDYPPTLKLDDAEAVSLMDSLWQAGIRPSEASNPSETVSAHLAHIETLKAFVAGMGEDHRVLIKALIFPQQPVALSVQTDL